MVKLLYFASLREALDSNNEQLNLPENITRINELKTHLAGRGGCWAQTFTDNTALLVSVNQQMANDNAAINDGDEIAFFPPVTGG